MSAFDRVPVDEFQLRGDGDRVLISCRVRYIVDAGIWRAVGGDGFVGESDAKISAVLSCFQAWMSRDRSYFDPDVTR